MELKTTELTKTFGHKTAVDHLNLSLSKGVYGLLGANGAGKTTLMRLLCNLQRPTSGKIFLNGENIGKLGFKRVGRKVCQKKSEGVTGGGRLI